MSNFTFSLLEQQIKNHPKVLIATHQDPDDDAMGAVLTINELVKRWGGQPHIFIFGKIDSGIKFSGPILTEDETGVDEFETILIVDTINPARTGLALPENWEKMPKTFIIDHHIVKEEIKYPKNFYFISRPEAAASCEIIYDLLKEKDEKISPLIAFYLLAGLYADSGGFSHSNTTPALLKKSNELLKKGVIFKNIVSSTFKGKKVKTLNFWGEKVKNSFYNPKLNFVSAWLTDSEIKAKNISPEEIGGLVNILNMCEEARFSVFLRETEEGKIKGSLRSSEKKKMNVNALSRFFGGGGHRLAAGFEVNGKIVEKDGKITLISR